jgi:hypothetical protein
MPKLSDGSWAPSYLSCHTSTVRQSHALDLVDANSDLHMGYVVAIHYPGDAGYTNSKFALYDIVAPITVKGGSTTWMTFYNARWAAGAGGSSQDFTRMRLSTPKGWKAGSALTKEMMEQSSYVAFFCENGRSQLPVIVGLAEHPSLFPDSKDYGHYYAQSFNGVNTLIDKDGQYSVTFTGAILDATSNAYKTAPEATTGTTILLDKEGSLLLDNVKGESVRLNKTDKAIQIKARGMSTVVSDKDHTTNVPNGKVYFLAGQNAVFNGKKIYIGAETTTEPLVLGTQLTIFVKNLLNAFLMKPFVGVLGNMPIMLHPDVRKDLMTLIPYGTPVSRFLSKKGFVE